MANEVALVRSAFVGGHMQFSESGAGRLILPSVLYTIRQRFTIAEVNAGATLLAALAGFKYRMVDASIIAVGGNAAAHTSIDISGTVSTARKLVAFLVAGTTQSTMLRAGAATNGVILADGASFTANDANTAITVGKTGSDVTTASHVDISFSYVIEPA